MFLFIFATSMDRATFKGESVISNNSSFLGLRDILQNHSYNTRSSLLVAVSERFCNSHIHKSIGKRLSALFLLSCVHNSGMLLLIVILLPF